MTGALRRSICAPPPSTGTNLPSCQRRSERPVISPVQGGSCGGEMFGRWRAGVTSQRPLVTPGAFGCSHGGGHGYGQETAVWRVANLTAAPVKRRCVGEKPHA